MIQPLTINGLWTWTPHRIYDARGWFSETFSQQTLDVALKNVSFVQDNQFYSKRAGIVRGLHFQIPPMAQDKLIRVVRGSILDVAVDIRRRSPTFGEHARVVLSAETGIELFIPKGFAHGLITLESDTEVLYKLSNFFSTEHERGILWSDPMLNIDWGIRKEEALLSNKDSLNPLFSNMPIYFE